MTENFADPAILDSMIQDALAEDIQNGDITCEALKIQKKAQASILSKQDGVLSGIQMAKSIFLILDSDLNISCHKKDGDLLVPGDAIMSLRGQAASILSAERTALNFLGHLSGISTLTRAFVDEIAHTRCQILDTRKTTPLYRSLEKYAVSCGGGKNHRAGLWDMILIKENHIRAVGSIQKALTRALNYRKLMTAPVKIEIEVTCQDEFYQAIRYPIDMIMLDHFSEDAMRKAVADCPASIHLEASGNVTLQTVRSIAETGVHYISSGALTHSAPHFDFSLQFRE
jgi:nicotinate-nucleotide pyrophosphorylase (carboxylating)